MRVLVIIPSGFCFGLQNVTLAFFGALRGDVDAHFLNSRWNDGELPRRLSELGIPQSMTWFGMFSRRLDTANLRMSLEQLWRLPVVYRDVIRAYRRLKPDVVFMANHHEIILLWPLLLAFRDKVVCHMHDPPPAVPFQKLSFFFWRRAVGRFVCISHSVQNRLARLGRPLSDGAVIHNGVQVRELTTPHQRGSQFCTRFGWPADAVIVGITGQMSAQKGHEDFLEAARLISEDNNNVRFVIAGKPGESFQRQLGELIAAHGLQSLVGFPGWLNESSEFFDGIDIFVMASRHEEGFALVVAEAGERGVPVVCTRSGGAVEVVVDGVTGVIVNRSRPSEIAAAVERLVRDPNGRRAMGEAARDRVRREFDVAIQARQLARFLAREPLPVAQESKP